MAPGVMASTLNGSHCPGHCCNLAVLSVHLWVGDELGTWTKLERDVGCQWVQQPDLKTKNVVGCALSWPIECEVGP